MPVTSNKSNALLFTSKHRVFNELSSLDKTPSAVLLTLWEQWGFSDFQKVEPVVKRLVSLGCRCFVCAGNYSESLHDFIDDVILDMTLDDGEANTAFLTTWHDDDTDDEVADFFLNSPSLSSGLRLAIFDDDSLEDQRLKKTVATLAEQESQT